MNYSLLILLLTSLLGAPQSTTLPRGGEETVLKALEKHGTAFVRKKDIHAASIGIYKDGQVYSQHFGELILGGGQAPTDQTVYEVGSVTKTMTGYVLARAVQQGKLLLTDPLSDYLPTAYPQLEGITLQHLLTHTSGLPPFLPLEMGTLFDGYPASVPQDFYALEKAYSREQFFEDLKEVTPATEPGTTYAYSNVGAELIGFVLESVYGMKIDELLQEAFLDEAGMTQTSIAWTDEQQEYGTQGYWLDNTTPSPHLANTLWGTAGGVKMNMADMLRYMAWQLNGENLVAAESHRMLYDSGGSVKVAYFWRMQQDKYGTSYNHHGGTTGMQNWLFLFPDHNLGISIMTNQSGLKTPKFLAQTVQKILKDIVKV